MEHYELVQEMGSVERMTTQDRLKHARKRRTQQLKKFGQYERQLDKESTKKKKNQDKNAQQKRPKKSNKGRVIFAPNIALLEAAARNDLTEVKRLLESGVSPDVTNEDGLTALHQCCIDDSEEMMKLLLDYNANVNACDTEMWTPLHAAATCGHVTLCKHLIDRGAELLAVNADGNMPYDICEDEVTLDHIETEMAKRGITQEQIDMTRLATEHQMLSDLKEHASKGGDLEVLDNHGATMLHVAAANGYIEVAEFLLDNHVSVDTRDNESWQPVHAAAYWAQQDVLELLVESGADLDSKTKNGETAFDLADDPDLKQRILDLKDEIESKRSIRQQRQGSQRKHRVSSRNLNLRGHTTEFQSIGSTSMRRSSMRGDKSQLFKKEQKEEALHFGLNLMHDEELLMEAEEDQENLRPTDLDEVNIVVTSDDDSRQQPSPPASKPDTLDGTAPSALPTAGVTTININRPTPKPRSVNNPDSLSKSTGAKAKPLAPSNSNRPNQPQQQRQSSPANQRREDPTKQSNGQNAVQVADSQNASVQNASSDDEQTPPQSPPPHPGATHERRQSGSTLSDLKKHRSNSRENLLDQAVQNMFLDSVSGGRQQRPNPSGGGSPVQGRAPVDKAKNGHNNNNNAVHYNPADGQLRRYVAPTNAPVVGDDDKQNCCVIL
ncbi:protein phosphatase 1 regulatory subunit 16A-like isoform X1 [Littorina saxatilis]|uniref:Protein phosphatase 1 regulatory inhibitor subunit 16B n=1 Tax=Littorina saxatilis TaxID=31220 RepID=A0AAN9BZF3_9CAEN